MPHCRNRGRSLIVRAGKDRALLQQALKTPGKIRPEARQVVIAELIDDDRQDQLGLSLFGLKARPRLRLSRRALGPETQRQS